MARSERRTARNKITVEESSGNIFADIGLTSPHERLAKADLAISITEVIRARRLTQRQAARMLKIDETKSSGLLHGHLSGFSAEALTHFLACLSNMCL